MSYPAETDESAYSHGHHEKHDHSETAEHTETADQTGFTPDGQPANDQATTGGFNDGSEPTGALTADTDEFGTVPPTSAETVDGDRTDADARVDGGSDDDAGLINNENFDTDASDDQDPDATATHAPTVEDTDGDGFHAETDDEVPHSLDNNSFDNNPVDRYSRDNNSVDTDSVGTDNSVDDAVLDGSDAEAIDDEAVNTDATDTDDASVTEDGSDDGTAEFVGDDAADEDIVLGDGSAADDPSVDGFAAGTVNADDDSSIGDDSVPGDNAVLNDTVLNDTVLNDTVLNDTVLNDAVLTDTAVATPVTDEAAPTGLLPGEAPLANTTTEVLVDDPALHERWQQAQLSFIDDPRAATESARSIAAEALQAHISALQARQSELDSWQNDGSPDTEVLRAAMRGYRDLVDHLTS